MLIPLCDNYKKAIYQKALNFKNNSILILK